MKLSDKIVWPPPGKYLLAVSGGIDSMVLLDLLAGSKHKYQLEVGFIDHGWRNVSKELDLVRRRASEYGLRLHEASLSLTNQSEAAARHGRYRALEKMRVKCGAQSVITAHHADDQVETVVLNLLRGTGRKGLEGMQPTSKIARPLLNLGRGDIAAYARKYQLEWLEDPSNLDTKYRRNYIRRKLLPKLTISDPKFSQKILDTSKRMAGLNSEIDDELVGYFTVEGDVASFGMDVVMAMRPEVLQEALVLAVRNLHPAVELDASAVERLAIDLKTGHFNRPRQLTKQLFAHRANGTLAIEFKAL